MGSKISRMLSKGKLSVAKLDLEAVRAQNAAKHPNLYDLGTPPGMSEKLNTVKRKYGVLIATSAIVITGASYFSLQGHVYNLAYYCSQNRLVPGLELQPKRISAELESLVYKVQEDLKNANFSPVGVLPSEKPIFAVNMQVDSDELKLQERERFHLKASDSRPLCLFLCHGFTTIHRGHRSLLNGAALGLPLYFTFKDVADLNADMTTEPFREAPEVLLLSDAARRFALARDLFLLQQSPSYVFAHLCGLVFVLATTFYVGGIKASLATRILGKIFCLGSYPYVRNAIHYLYDAQADTTASGVSPLYRQGAIEFYTKQAEREAILLKRHDGDAAAAHGELNKSVSRGKRWWLSPGAVLDALVFDDWTGTDRRLQNIVAQVDDQDAEPSTTATLPDVDDITGTGVEEMTS